MKIFGIGFIVGIITLGVVWIVTLVNSNKSSISIQMHDEHQVIIDTIQSEHKVINDKLDKILNALDIKKFK